MQPRKMLGPELASLAKRVGSMDVEDMEEANLSEYDAVMSPGRKTEDYQIMGLQLD